LGKERNTRRESSRGRLSQLERFLQRQLHLKVGSKEGRLLRILFFPLLAASAVLLLAALFVAIRFPSVVVPALFNILLARTPKRGQ
jgi:hypothetical protein